MMNDDSGEVWIDVTSKSLVLPLFASSLNYLRIYACYTRYHKRIRPLDRAGFDSLNMSAPILVQMNPEGKWENRSPVNSDEEGLKAVVQYLVDSNAVSAAQSFCCQCAAENQRDGAKSSYVPVIMMPISPAEQCPFDMDCEVQKIKEIEAQPTKAARKTEQTRETDKEKEKQKTKKRGFVLQRLTDFDLLSQW